MDSIQARNPHSAQNVDWPGEIYNPRGLWVWPANLKFNGPIFGGFENAIHTLRKESIDLVLDVELLLYLVSLLFKLSPKGFSHSQLSKKGRHADPRRRPVSESV